MANRPPALKNDRGTAVVTKMIRGRRFRKPLGKFGTPEAELAYQDFLADLRAGRADWSNASPPDTPAAVDTAPAHPAGNSTSAYCVAECLDRWLAIELRRNITQGEHDKTRRVADIVDTLFGTRSIDTLRPAAIESLRQYFRDVKRWGFQMIRDGERRVRNFVGWCVVAELAAPETGWILDRMPRFQVGDLGTTEPVRKTPIGVEPLEQVLPFLSPSLQDFLKVQFICGMRPCEVSRLRGMRATGNPQHAHGDRPVWQLWPDTDTWIYRFDDHKTRKKTKKPLFKAVPPAAMQILQRHIEREDKHTNGQGWLLRPSVSHSERIAALPPRKHSRRLTGGIRRYAAATKRRLARQFGDDDYYTNYGQAIRRGVDRAIKAGAVDAKWTPNQLRHGIGTMLSDSHGFDAAAIYLGHTDSKTTQTYYAHLDDTRARQLIRVADAVQSSLACIGQG